LQRITGAPCQANGLGLVSVGMPYLRADTLGGSPGQPRPYGSAAQERSLGL